MWIKMFTGSMAALSQITKLMYMYSMLGIGVEPLHDKSYFSWSVYTILTKRSNASYLRVIGIEYADGMSPNISYFALVLIE
jgi:hypothetical protein